jgi:uncharacterized protein (TIRG00374 family)
MLKKINGISIKYGLSSIVIEKLYDILLIGFLFLPSLLFLLDVINELQLFLIAGLITTVFFLLLLFQTMKMISLLTWVLKSAVTAVQQIPPVNKLIQGKFPIQLDNLNSLRILGKKTIVKIFILTIFRFILLVTRLYLLGKSLELGIPLHLFIVGIPIAQMALAFAITPGAIGFLEGGWYAILTFGGISEIERSAFLIGQRVYLSLFIGIIFILTYLVLGIRQLNKLKTNENHP